MGIGMLSRPYSPRFTPVRWLPTKCLQMTPNCGDKRAAELSAYDRLLLGDADTCAADALAVIDDACGFIPDHVRAARPSRSTRRGDLRSLVRAFHHIVGAEPGRDANGKGD